MKKRLLSAFMALVLCLTLLPAPAWAAEDTPEGGTIVQEEQQEKAPAAESPAILEQAAENGIAAQNGGDSTVENAVAEVTIDSTTTQYTDIEKAFTAAQQAEIATVKLLENVTIPKTADVYSYGIQLKKGNITLDLNGCTIQTTGVASGFLPLYAVFYIEGSESSSSLTVQNSTGGGKIMQPNGGQAIHVGSNGTLTVESGAIEVTSTDESSSSYITTQNCAIFLNGGGTANILGGTLTGKQGIYVKNGTLNISGGTIHGKNSYALQVAQNAVTNYNSMVTLTGGSYTTGVENGCSIWNADGTAGNLLANGYRYQDDNGKESAYSENNNGVVGNTTVAERPVGEFSYIGADGTEQTHAGCTELTAAGFTDASAGEETWFAANSSFTADRPLQVCGTVNLILCDGVTVTLNKGIALNGQFTKPATLNIYAQSGGTGTLICSGPSNSGCAGIYDNSNGDGHEAVLNIYGGVITATGTSNPFSPICGAGIGSIGSYKYKSTMAVNISGGTVTAKSGGEGAQAIGNGTNPKGTVTVNIAPGMKCVKTDDPNTACEYSNTDGTSVTVTKCSKHEWEYKVENDKHTKTCKLCGASGGSEAHTYEKWTPDVSDNTKHIGTCVCGAKKSEAHTLGLVPNPDGLTHKTSCNRCGWTSADEQHDFRNGVCVCGIGKSAEYDGKQYASLQAAVNAAAASGGTVKLARDVSENVTVTGGAVTVDLNGKTWLADISENPDIWGRIPLTVTGGSVTLENGTLDQGHTSSMGSYGIRIQGGSVTVKGNAVVIGSNTTGSGANISYPAIRLESGGALTLETGAALVHGLEVPGGKTLSDYLPEGTAFRLRGYDESTKKLTGDKGLLNAYTINNYAEHNMALVVVEHKHTFDAGTTNCKCGFTCAQHDWSKKNGVCTVCGSACPHKAGATETGGVWACNTCGQTVTAMVTAPDPDGAITYYADGYVDNNEKSGLYFAIKAAETGSTVTALGGGKPAGGYVKNRKSLTLDVSNGKTIDGMLYVGDRDKGNKLIVRGSAEISDVIVDPDNTLDLTGWTGRIGSLTVQNGGKATLNGGTFATLYINGATAGSLLAEGYAFQNAGTGAYVEYSSTADMENVKVVKCPTAA